MSGYAISRFDNVQSWAQIALSTAAKQLFDSTTTALTPIQGTQGVQLTNNDASITIYLGYDNSVTSTKFVKQLLPGEYWEQLVGINVQKNIWAIAASGTPNISYARLG